MTVDWTTNLIGKTFIYQFQLICLFQSPSTQVLSHMKKSLMCFWDSVCKEKGNLPHQNLKMEPTLCPISIHYNQKARNISESTKGMNEKSNSRMSSLTWAFWCLKGVSILKIVRGEACRRTGKKREIGPL